MESQKDIIPSSYSKLLSQLKLVFIEGLKAIEKERINTYWQTGRLIHKHLLENKNRADYGKQLFPKLARDLNIAKITLYQAVKFYLQFPIVSARLQLSWTHYRLLLSVQDEAKRKFLLEQAIQGNWDCRRLEKAVRSYNLKVIEVLPKTPSNVAARLKFNRQALFTYRIIDPGYIHGEEGGAVVDLGFNINIQANVEAQRAAPLRSGDIIESVKTGDKYSFKISAANPKDLYVYAALVERVVDADTIWLNIDCGFKVWTRQKVRLRGIDAFELGTEKGEQAKRIVSTELKGSALVVAKTYKSDKYGRYLADIFYLPKERNPQIILENGTFLNQELLNLGLAKIFD